MSRCFPYPQPGYFGNGSSVSRSIKHQNNATKLVPEQSNSKRGRKFVKEEAKTKYFGDKSGQVKRSGKRKLVDYEREDTEKSDLSEEHEQPVRVFSIVEDKKGDEAASSVPKRNVLRFRLPLKKSKEADVPVCANQSASAVSFLPLKKCKESDVPANANQSTSVVLLPQPDSVVDLGQPALELRRDSSGGNDGPSLEIPSHKSKKHKKELQYDSLFRDWVPPTLEFQMEDDNEDWLFASKKQVRNDYDSKRVEVRNNDNFESSSTLWPTARFLPEANIYSLPFTVPF